MAANESLLNATNEQMTVPPRLDSVATAASNSSATGSAGDATRLSNGVSDIHVVPPALAAAQ